MAIPSASSPAGGMFSTARNIITGASFNITNNKPVGRLSLDVLYKRVAPNAILNAGGRADQVRCYPGTREEVIDRIENWADTRDGLTTPIFWLSGPAGAGKSAIVQTIAERCESKGVPQANFFFFRADSSRNHAYPFVATLLHQIILLYPSLRDLVATVLFTNPLIFDSVFESQLTQLIITPLRSLQQSSSFYRPLMLLIDGLNECDSDSQPSQQQILLAFDKVLAENPSLFRLLVASRNEFQMQVAFNKASSQCMQIYLNDQYSPEKDIWAFVNIQFEEVKKVHRLAHTLDASWPSVQDVNFIVEKSSGQFIYAAEMMRFISNSSASPKLSLERVKGSIPVATQSPFSHLDAVYTSILLQLDDQETLKDILHAQLFILQFNADMDKNGKGSGMTILDLLQVCNKKYPMEEMVISCLADLNTIAFYSFSSGQLQFYHGSFQDYLLNQSRSGDYFVDITAFIKKNQKLETLSQSFKK
ncbi:hypothetical protein D9619_010656 [Psilocybe cf. subviscida]|uniref:Nephrocystin 3-like N-terminal domain-containing protein n=1 Tax=Psilocybe cf. subviscida TaxID=2480587 RepID=A0A8H5F0F2_9AGAR|nr:hypothetical protein D9619_010656 [Psilocybe cf. subviscida]